ncbi:hypothetical protein B0H11DRAFT_1899150 [Mycena galericulata]|nr:hypothetical protein B0H11DRAFT_1899150 [Mycena galericulata]
MPASPGAELHLSFYKHTSEHGRHSASVGRVWRGGEAEAGGEDGEAARAEALAYDDPRRAALEAGDYWPRRRPSAFHPPAQARIAPRDDEGVQIVAQAVSASPSSDFGAQFVTDIAAGAALSAPSGGGVGMGSLCQWSDGGQLGCSSRGSAFGLISGRRDIALGWVVAVAAVLRQQFEDFCDSV